MHPPETVPGMQETYTRCRDLLYHALARLAAQGFSAQPVEGQDLIHDFFVEEWCKLAGQYDAKRGSLEAYVYAAFVRFARRRIIYLQRWQLRLHDAAILAQVLAARAERSPAEIVERQEELACVGQALEALPADERTILLDYLAAGPRSQRSLARQHGLSRYRLRECLVEALGQVAIQIGERGHVPADDWQVALALWREGRTLEEAADYLGRPPTEIRQARSRFFDLVSAGLQHTPACSAPRERIRAVKHMHPNHLLQAIYCSPEDQSLWKQLRNQARDVRRWLETSVEDVGPDAEQDEDADLDPEVTAQIYRTLAPTEESVEEALGTGAALLEESEREDREIGRSFKEDLLAGLNARLRDLDTYFASAPALPKREYRDLLKSADVQAALPEADSLARHGLSPVRILYATKGMVTLAERLMHHNLMPRSSAFVLLDSDEQSTSEEWPVLLSKAADEEIALAARCGLGTAPLLRGWLVGVAQFKPHLFPGGVAKVEGRHVVVSRSDQESELSLAQRWGISHRKRGTKRDRR